MAIRFMSASSAIPASEVPYSGPALAAAFRREESLQRPRQSLRRPRASIYENCSMRMATISGGPWEPGKTISSDSRLEGHYDRQRVLFYSAESLRNFARDRTPPRTFDSLQDDVYNGVIDICEAVHSDALERLRTTITTAGQLDVSGNALVGVTKVADKQGICHQLANDDRLIWRQEA